MRRSTRSWLTTLSKLGFQRPRKRRRPALYNRRQSSLEQLEPRQLLANAPWIGSDRVLADFDGDGNIDRLSSLSAPGSINEVWYVDTKAASSASTTETWRVTRGDGAPPAYTLPQQQQHVVGDFNGDGRDDILAREATGPWYVVESRGSIAVGQTKFDGEFVISLWGAPFATGPWTQPIVGDFDGDGRDDLAAFNAANSNDLKWEVARSTGTNFEPVKTWATSTFSPNTATVISGDFNGDGRDDLWFKKSSSNNWAIAVSDGTRFNVVDPTTAVATVSWPKIHKGDFNGDGADELLGWNISAARWDVLDYDDHRGMRLETHWGAALGTGATLAAHHIGDVNRDERDDLIAYDTSTTKWNVALAQPQSTGITTFVLQSIQPNGEGDWTRWLNDWDWGNIGYEYVNVDAAYEGFLDHFASVYNTIELEFHPGLMKSPVVTEETKAGNHWEQAALLVAKLEAIGFDADIATGQVRTTFDNATKWIGAKDWIAAYSIIKSAFDPAATYDAAAQTITFVHAWVRALVPMADGLKWVNVDPSWKFKDLQVGVELAGTGVSGLLTTFDEFARQHLFTKLNGKFAKTQLPIEAYEDQVMDRLVETPELRGNSLAEVPFDGPIIAKQFDQIPLMSVTGPQVLTDTTNYGSFSTIVADTIATAALTHRVEITITTSHSNPALRTLVKTMIVPKSALDTTKVWYTAGTAGNVVPHLTIAGQDEPPMAEVANNSTVTITIKHLDPDQFGNLSGFDNEPYVYTRRAGEIVIVSLDANQISRSRIVQMQGDLNEALSTITESDIHQLLAYTGAKYWHDYNRDLTILNGLSHTVDVQQRVGSGLVTSKSTYTTQSHLDFPLVPDGMNVDLKNWVVNPTPLGPASSSFIDVLRLAAFNASALENAVIEEVINAESISTVKGIQLYLDTATLTPTDSEKVLIIERGPSDTSNTPYRVVARYDQNGDQEISTAFQWNADILRNNLSLDTSIETEIIQKLDAAGATNRIWVPIGPTSVTGSPGWTGTVYIYEKLGASSTQLQYLIQKTGGAPASGGDQFGHVLGPNPTLPSSTFLNQTVAGDPVNVANGNMFRDDLDFKFANPHLPLDFARHYDSQNKLGTGLGVGWTHSFTGIIYQELGQVGSSYKRTWLRGNGERHTFRDNVYQLPSSLFGEIETSDSGPIEEFRAKDGTTYVFDSESFAENEKHVLGRLVSIKHAGDDAVITIEYDGTSTRVKTVTSSASPGRYLEFSYGTTPVDNSITVQVKRFENGIKIDSWSYKIGLGYFGPNGNRLIEVKKDGQESSITKYEYHTSGPDGQKGLMSKITEPNGETHSYEYYANGRVFRVTDGEGNEQAFNYNQFRNLTEFTDERGNVETYIHQDNGLLTKQIHNDRSRLEFTWGALTNDEEFLMTSSTDEVGGKETFDYYPLHEVNGRKGELEESTAKDGLVTRYEYANSGPEHISRLTKIIVDPHGSQITTLFTRDPFGRIWSSTDAEGNRTEYQYYDAAGPGHLRGLRKSETLPKGILGGEAFAWEVLASDFSITGDTLAVQLLSSPGYFVRADAIRIDRLDSDGVFTRVADDTTAANDAHFRVETGSFTPTALTSPIGYAGDYFQISNATAEQAAATWIFTGLLPGKYRVSATWAPSTSNDPTATYRLYNGLPDSTIELSVSNVSQQSAPDSFSSYQTVYTYDTAGNVISAFTEGLPAARRSYDINGNVVYSQDPTGVTTYNEYDLLGRLVRTSIIDSTNIDFGVMPILRFHGLPGDTPGSWDSSNVIPKVINNGHTVYITGNSRKAVEVNYTVTPGTILEFDYKATGQAGEIHAIGLGNSLISTLSKGFYLAGTYVSEWGGEYSLDFNNYVIGSGTKHYQIPIGRYLAPGAYKYLVFVNSDYGSVPWGGAAQGESYYSNLRMHESVASNTAPQFVNFTSGPASNIESFHGQYAGTLDAFGIAEAQDNGSTLYMHGNNRKAIRVDYHVTKDTVLDFYFKADAQGEVHGIGLGRGLKQQLSKGFILYGTDATNYEPEWTRAYDTYSGTGYHPYQIRLADFLTPGFYEYLVFVNADWGGAPAGEAGEGNSYFFNVTLREVPPSDGRIKFSHPSAPTVPINLQSYHGPFAFSLDQSGTVEVRDAGATLYMHGNNRKAVPLNYDVTPETVLEFDFLSSAEGEVQGIAIANDLKAHVSQGFLLTGTDQNNYGPEWSRDYDTYVVNPSNPQSKHFVIPIGKYLKSGLQEYLVLTNGDWNAPYGNSSFSNIRVYDPAAVSITSTGYDASGRILSTTDALGRTATNQYDGNGRLIRQTFADGTFTLHKYDAIGNCIAITDELGRKTRYVYDDRNRRIQTTYADGSSTSMRYDGAGRILQSTDELGRTTDFKHDPVGRLYETQKSLQYGTDPPTTIVTKSTYDHLGNLVRTVDGNGNATVWRYDRLGRVVETRTLDVAYASETAIKDESAKPPIAVSTTAYDANGQVIAETAFETTILSASIPTEEANPAVNFHNTRLLSFHGPFEYTLDTSGSPTALDGGRTLFMDGNSRKAVDINYRVTADTVLEFDYKADALPEIIGIGVGNSLTTIPTRAFYLGGSGFGGWPNWTNWTTNPPNPGGTYSPNGVRHYEIPLGQILTPAQLVEYKHLIFVNSDNRQTPLGLGYFSNVRVYDDVLPKPSLASIAQLYPQYVQITRFAYDTFGRPVDVTNADGTTTSTIYDAAGRVRYTFDELGRKTELLYDNFGRHVLTMSPDPDGNFGGAEVPFRLYARDKFGNITQEWERFGKYGGLNDGVFADRHVYDARNRLVTTIRKDNTQVESVFDVAGQPVATIDALRNSTYTTFDHRGRVVEQRLADPDGSDSQVAPVTAHEYDRAGNTVATTDPLGNTTTFAYDSLNRLREEKFHDFTSVVDNVFGSNATFFTAGNATVQYDQNHPTFGPYYIEGDVAYWWPWDTSNADNAPKATWKFEDLDAGTYRVAMTWRASPEFDSDALVEILVNGNNFNSKTIDQRYPGIIPNSPTTPLIRWTVLHESVAASAGAKIEVRITGTGGNWLMADAVRIDRVVSRSYDYDNSGNLIRTTDGRGNVTEETYDELNRLRRTITADPDGASSALRSLVTDRSYDGYGNVVTEKHGYLAQPPAQTTILRTDTYEYDKRNRLLKKTIDSGVENVVTQYTYDDVGNTTLVIDPLLHETYRRYDNLNRLIDEYENIDDGRPEQPNVTFNESTILKPYTPSLYTGTTSVSGDGKSLTLTGDMHAWIPIGSFVANHRTVLEFELQVDQLPDYVAIGFDTNGFFNGSVDERRHFELAGRKTLGGSFITEFHVDTLPDGFARFHVPIGQYLTDSEKQQGLTLSHLAVYSDVTATLQPADLRHVTFRNVRLYNSDEVRTVTTYDARGNVATVRTASDPRNITTRYEYDRLGRQTHETLDAGGAMERKYVTMYDAAGNVRAEQRPSGPEQSPSTVQTIHEYDRLHRLVKTTLPDPDGVPGGATGLASEVMTFAYDAAGNLIRETNGENESTLTAYDSQGRVISETDGNGDVTHYRYDTEGNITAVIDAEDNKTSYTYDGLNRLKTETIKAMVEGQATPLTRTHAYDIKGNLFSITDRNGRVRKFNYDTLDRRTKEEWFANASDPSPDHTLTWDYDKLDRITRQFDGVVNAISTDDVIDTFKYDGLGRLTEQTNYDRAAAPGASGRPEIWLTYQYVFEVGTTVNDFRQRTYRNQYDHDAGDRGIARSLLQSDRLGRLWIIDDADLTSGPGDVAAVERKNLTFEYDAAGNLNEIVRRSNLSGSVWQTELHTDYAHDKADRLSSITHDLATDIVHSYGYDNASRITSFNTGTTTRGYGYDEAGQLTSKNGGTSESYIYDDNGNRELVTNAQGSNQDFAPSLANRMSSDGTYSYKYDKEGNIIQRWVTQSPGSRTYYTWDHRNRLTRVSEWFGDHEALIVDHRYDADGGLVFKRTDKPFESGAEVEYYVLESGQPTMRFNDSSQLANRYLYGPLTDQIITDEVFATSGGQQVSDELLWQLADHQGTIRDIVDDNGVLRKHVDYDSFGAITGQQYYAENGSTISNPSTHSEAVDQLFYYTGQQWDANSNLYNYNARWYDPKIGRFLSEDPSGLDGGDPNLYRYVSNSPLNFTDPTGLYQAGNPLDSLYGGYAAGSVQGPKSINSFIAGAGLTPIPGVPAFNPLPFAAPSLTLPPTPNRQLDPVLSQASQAYWQRESQRFLFDPVYADRLALELRPNGSDIVDVRQIGGVPAGNIFRQDADQLARRFSGNGPVDRLVYSTVKAVGYVEGAIVDTLLPVSDPGYFVTTRDGTQTYYMGEGPSWAGLTGQASVLAPAVLGGALRPAGDLNFRSQQGQSAGAGNTRPTFLNVSDDGIDLTNYSSGPPSTSTSGSRSSGYWWPGRYSTGASQPGAYQASGGKVFPTRRNSGLEGEALRGAQEAFTRIKLLEGNPVQVVRGQAGEAGLTVHGSNAKLADQGAENAVQRAIKWFENRRANTNNR